MSEELEILKSPEEDGSQTGHCCLGEYDLRTKMGYGFDEEEEEEEE
ncbi:hypothetical protein [Pseudomonas sp. R5(2019)]|nr:hypothetical protein [Pseudomonas sp. R5(2019)]NBA98594.1 hypothetical protein [Pseudomonas sp. R5(2019)]